jgi:predicted transglutaminase-like cysteine proteinase
MKKVKGLLGVCCVVALSALATPQASAAEHTLFVSTGAETRPPIGWIEFCADNPDDCKSGTADARDIVLTSRSWKAMARVNKLVNDKIKPLTDLEHYGVVEKWSYPDDGYGDCEDYVLLKKRVLVDAGWPASALLITVVRDQNGEGHAVLTVKTDRGEFVLDNQNTEIVLWSDTPYHYVKRQSQQDPNVWIALGDQRPSVVTATSR